MLGSQSVAGSRRPNCESSRRPCRDVSRQDGQGELLFPKLGSSVKSPSELCFGKISLHFCSKSPKIMKCCSIATPWWKMRATIYRAFTFYQVLHSVLPRLLLPYFSRQPRDANVSPHAGPMRRVDTGRGLAI